MTFLCILLCMMASVTTASPRIQSGMSLPSMMSMLGRRDKGPSSIRDPILKQEVPRGSSVEGQVNGARDALELREAAVLAREKACAERESIVVLREQACSRREAAGSAGHDLSSLEERIMGGLADIKACLDARHDSTLHSPPLDKHGTI